MVESSDEKNKIKITGHLPEWIHSDVFLWGG